MSKIRILPEQLANRIAAGEVVERPASVVKELLENSLDAGATRIEIEIEGSGTRLIRVMDNGEGMGEDDLLLCLERHGTSKIATGEDLAAINSLGFRGEAIPSIGSVSKMTITSRPAEAPLGARVVMDYGKLIKVHETGCSRGTIFEIRNLFGNTPARRKFLRTARTELAHIEEVVKGYALAGATTFILRVDGREILRFDENQALPDRLRAILHYQGPLIEIGRAQTLFTPRNMEASMPGGQASAIPGSPDTGASMPGGQASAIPGSPDTGASMPGVHGWLLPPDAAVAGTAGIRLLVNGRTVRDRLLVHSVAAGLRNFLMKGRNPAGLIHLRLAPGDVDVNVHPTKQEIRLRDSRAIHQLLTQSVEQAMLKHQKSIQGAFFRTPSSAPGGPAAGPAQEPSPPAARQTPLIAKPTSGPPIPPTRQPWPTRRDPAPPKASSPPPENRPIPERPISPAPYKTASHPVVAPLPQTAEPAPLVPQPVTVPPGGGERHPLRQAATPAHNLRIIGQYNNLYIFCQAADGGLLVIDQHAAHERLLFEDLKKQFLSGRIAGQTLLFPTTIELSLSEAELVERHLPEIERMGFSLREFGGNSFVISAIPAMAGQCRPDDLLRDILERFGNAEAQSPQGTLLDDILASMACKAAVKSGDSLHTREMDALLTRMAGADLFSHCPHGRPVLKHFTLREVNKWFHRP